METPTEDEPAEAEELADGDVPLADVPQTGDMLMSWLMAAAVSGSGLAWMGLRKKKEEEQ